MNLRIQIPVDFDLGTALKMFRRRVVLVSMSIAACHRSHLVRKCFPNRLRVQRCVDGVGMSA